MDYLKDLSEQFIDELKDAYPDHMKNASLSYGKDSIFEMHLLGLSKLILDDERDSRTMSSDDKKAASQYYEKAMSLHITDLRKHGIPEDIISQAIEFGNVLRGHQETLSSSGGVEYKP